jgi:hypothetical protein
MRALELMQSGRLYRYNVASAEESEVQILKSLFERVPSILPLHTLHSGVVRNQKYSKPLSIYRVLASGNLSLSLKVPSATRRLPDL